MHVVPYAFNEKKPNPKHPIIKFKKHLYIRLHLFNNHLLFCAVIKKISQIAAEDFLFCYLSERSFINIRRHKTINEMWWKHQ